MTFSSWSLSQPAVFLVTSFPNWSFGDLLPQLVTFSTCCILGDLLPQLVTFSACHILIHSFTVLDSLVNKRFLLSEVSKTGVKGVK